jgi:hypothetical protein
MARFMLESNGRGRGDVCEEATALGASGATATGAG